MMAINRMNTWIQSNFTLIIRNKTRLLQNSIIMPVILIQNSIIMPVILIQNSIIMPVILIQYINEIRILSTFHCCS